MGLFGRDERSGDATRAKETVPARRPAAPQPAEPSGETTLIAETTSIEGTIRGSGDIRIEGRITGTVDATGRLLVAASGRAKATLNARVVVVAGTVEGDVTADERIELQPTARLTGNITAPKIHIQEGASFEGEVRMAKPDHRKPQADADGPPAGAGTPPQASSARRPARRNGKKSQPG